MHKSERQAKPEDLHGASAARTRLRSGQQLPAHPRDAAQRVLLDAIHGSPRARDERARLQTLQARRSAADTPAQLRKFFADQNAASTQSDTQPELPFWVSPLSEGNNTLYPNAQAAQTAAEADLGTKAGDPLDTVETGAGTAGNGAYRYWTDYADPTIKVRATHTQDNTNKLLKVGKAGFGVVPVVEHSHAGTIQAGPGQHAGIVSSGKTPYTAVNLAHYLHKPGDPPLTKLPPKLAGKKVSADDWSEWIGKQGF